MLPMGSDSGFSSSQVVVLVPTLPCGMLCVFLSSPYKHAKVRAIGKSAINLAVSIKGGSLKYVFLRGRPRLIR